MLTAAGLTTAEMATARNDLAERMAEARSITGQLLDIIHPDSWYERPIAERHRLIFYLGHLEAFDWNLIAGKGLGVPSFHPSFDKLFEFGIDPPEGSLPSDQPGDWPTVAEVHEYNRRTREKLDLLLGEAPEVMVRAAIEHRLMHAETLAYLLHGLNYEHKLARTEGPVPETVSHSGGMIAIPAGTTTLGQNRDEFGWDNEFSSREVFVRAFSVSKYKVTNREYLEFVREGAAPPHFWSVRGDRIFWRGMFREIPLPLDWPVYATQEEAANYAKWRGFTLLSEEQFHRAAYSSLAEERKYPWGNAPPDSSRGNFNFQRWDPAPANAYAEGDSAWGVSQLVGNGWEWTSTVFAPFPGFEPFPFYPGYSSNFFDGNHYVMKGASPRTASCFLRRSFRNWFRSRYPYVYATFRLAANQ